MVGGSVINTNDDLEKAASPRVVTMDDILTEVSDEHPSKERSSADVIVRGSL